MPVAGPGPGTERVRFADGGDDSTGKCAPPLIAGDHYATDVTQR